jgi:DNA replication and repair protein RecF
VSAEAPAGIARLTLADFRSYPALTLETLAPAIALIGDNGAGKTNLLEALSLFTPGRGLRRAELADMARIEGPGGFAVSALMGDADGHETRLGVGLTPPDAEGRRQRLTRIDGVDAGSASVFAAHIRVVWLTPDMDGLFRGAAGDRRRFLDRLVLAVDASHAPRSAALDRALRQRNRILEEDWSQSAWLDAIEREVAELGIAVAAARAETVGRLAGLIAQRQKAGNEPHETFPAAGLALAGEIDALVAMHPAIEAEDRYRALLRDSRARDRAAGRTLIGPQASDLMVRHLIKDMPAAQGSTGEQKALLIGLVLAHARLVSAMSGLAPIILLDEIAAHLDARRRVALYRELAAIGGQVWMTGTDANLFEELQPGAARFMIAGGQAQPL